MDNRPRPTGRINRVAEITETQRTARSVNRPIVPALRKPLPAVEWSHVMATHENLCEIPAIARPTGRMSDRHRR